MIGRAEEDPIMALREMADTLKLTTAQRDSLAVIHRQFEIARDSVLGNVAHKVGTVPQKPKMDEIYARLMGARSEHIDMLISALTVAKEVLTPAQRRQMPRYEARRFETKYLEALRDGTGTYVDTRGGL